MDLEASSSLGKLGPAGLEVAKGRKGVINFQCLLQPDRNCTLSERKEPRKGLLIRGPLVENSPSQSYRY